MKAEASPESGDAIVVSRERSTHASGAPGDGAPRRMRRHSSTLLSDAERSRIVGNLLTVICGDAKVQPTFSINERVQAADRTRCFFNE